MLLGIAVGCTEPKRAQVAPAGEADTTPFAHPGEELLYVLAGRLEVRLEDDPPIVLDVGDSLHFDAMRSHVFTARGTPGARYLLVAAHPHA